uniref:Uncharacterized protein n=1 Tax=Ananas comosus var. bracteatus TaxID=296719 RepID=A0A6V7PT04_ANACO|nr:unnamed protein product [Ananas comosus var. bracteatus]
MRERSAAGQSVVVPDAVVCALANMVGQITLSRRVFDAQGTASNAYKDMIVELLTGAGLFSVGDFVPAVAWMDLQGVQKKMQDIHRRFDKMIEEMLAEHAAGAAERRRQGRTDFVDVVLANRQGDDGRLSRMSTSRASSL